MRNNIYTFIAIIFSGIASLSAQSFQKTIGGSGLEEALCIKKTNDKGYIIVGSTQGFGAGNGDVYLVKTDSNFAITWTKTFGGTEEDIGYAVEQTSDNGYILTGTTESASSNFDIVLIKTDASGNLTWSKTYGGNNDAMAYCVKQTSDEGYILAGTTSAYGYSSYDVYLIKTNAGGDTLWTKTYGGSGSEEAYSILQTADNGYIMTGQTNSFGAGTSDIFVLKTTADGILSWAKTYGGSGYDFGNCIQPTSTNGFVIGGYSYSFGSGLNDFYLLNIAANGNLNWSKTYGSTGDEYGNAVVQMPDSGYAFTGYRQPTSTGVKDVMLVRTNSIGDTLWTSTYGGSSDEIGNSLLVTSDKGLLIAGSTVSLGQASENIYLIKTTPSGFGQCYQSHPTLMTSSPATVTGNANFITKHGGQLKAFTYSVSSGGTVQTICTSAAINEERDESAIRIFPNPASDVITIENTVLSKNTSMAMYDGLGKQVWHQALQKNTSEIDVTNLGKGVYFIVVTNGLGNIIRKFVKE